LLERLKVRRLGKEKDKLDDARKINRREESKKDRLKEASKEARLKGKCIGLD